VYELQVVNLTPTFTDRHVHSFIQVPNGQTVLLAGLIQEEQDKTRAGIPVLDQIPVLGEAFANNNNSSVTRTELIFFIRPQVIHDGVDASNVAEELRSKMRGDKIGTAHPAGAVTLTRLASSMSWTRLRESAQSGLALRAEGAYSAKGLGVAEREIAAPGVRKLVTYAALITLAGCVAIASLVAAPGCWASLEPPLGF